MLSTIPASPYPSLPPRRRGGQPGNSNARKHGLYAARPLHPRAALFKYAPPKPLSPSPAFDRASQRRLLQDLLRRNRQRQWQIFDLLSEPLEYHEFRAWHECLMRTVSGTARLGRALYKLDRDRILLRKLARDLPLLIDYEFNLLHIRPRPIFVPQKLNNFDTDSSRGGPFLTDSQWFLLSGSLESLRRELDAFRAHRPRKNAPSPRLLLEGVLFKLAFGLRWADLPRLYHSFHPELSSFPLRAAQRLYRQLYRSGLMRAIYERLHEHLVGYGDLGLEELIQQGAFTATESRITLSPGQPLDWQVFTALLLLQRAFHNRRLRLRERASDRRRAGRYLRFPSLRAKSIRRKRAAPRQDGPNFPAVGGPTARLPSESPLIPLSKSPAWKKWRDLASTFPPSYPLIE